MSNRAIGRLVPTLSVSGAHLRPKKSLFDGATTSVSYGRFIGMVGFVPLSQIQLIMHSLRVRRIQLAQRAVDIPEYAKSLSTFGYSCITGNFSARKEKPT